MPAFRKQMVVRIIRKELIVRPTRWGAESANASASAVPKAEVNKLRDIESLKKVVSEDEVRSEQAQSKAFQHKLELAVQKIRREAVAERERMQREHEVETAALRSELEALRRLYAEQSNKLIKQGECSMIEEPKTEDLVHPEPETMVFTIVPVQSEVATQTDPPITQVAEEPSTRPKTPRPETEEPSTRPKTPRPESEEPSTRPKTPRPESEEPAARPQTPRPRTPEPRNLRNFLYSPPNAANAPRADRWTSRRRLRVESETDEEPPARVPRPNGTQPPEYEDVDEELGALVIDENAEYAKPPASQHLPEYAAPENGAILRQSPNHFMLVPPETANASAAEAEIVAQLSDMARPRSADPVNWNPPPGFEDLPAPQVLPYEPVPPGNNVPTVNAVQPVVDVWLIIPQAQPLPPPPRPIAFGAGTVLVQASRTR